MTEHTPEIEHAWAAGFADGEAWFGATHRHTRQQKRGEPPRGYWRLSVSVGQKHRGTLERFQAAVGGGGSICGPYRHAPGFWTYRADARMARQVIAVLTPYLSEIKVAQIDAARVRCADHNAIATRPASSDRTVCPAGHPYTGVNAKGARICHPCLAARERRRQKVLRDAQRR